MVLLIRPKTAQQQQPPPRGPARAAARGPAATYVCAARQRPAHSVRALPLPHAAARPSRLPSVAQQQPSVAQQSPSRSNAAQQAPLGLGREFPSPPGLKDGPSSGRRRSQSDGSPCVSGDQNPLPATPSLNPSHFSSSPSRFSSRALIKTAATAAMAAPPQAHSPVRMFHCG